MILSWCSMKQSIYDLHITWFLSEKLQSSSSSFHRQDDEVQVTPSWLCLLSSQNHACLSIPTHIYVFFEKTKRHWNYRPCSTPKSWDQGTTCRNEQFLSQNCSYQMKSLWNSHHIRKSAMSKELCKIYGFIFLLKSLQSRDGKKDHSVKFIETDKLNHKHNISFII